MITAAPAAAASTKVAPPETIKTGDIPLTEMKVMIQAQAAPLPAKEHAIGDIVRLKAAHGRMQHPFTLIDFSTEHGARVQYDEWVHMQYQACKLVDEE